MFNIGFGELVLILIIALVVFGPGKLPEISRALGKSVREFRQAADTFSKEMMSETEDTRQAVRTVTDTAAETKKEITVAAEETKQAFTEPLTQVKPVKTAVTKENGTHE
ncbi:Sec-independent protein translocase protein TatB [Megasphaera hominis]|uniref:Sec-independent protein translocase protein TatA n=1 Tax=Megasphaera hominis TaxID=159836 RepID=A0ABR6VG99_9FIRM|nr:Sec-independent protein translocase protein TatB [Megasphaera hominis]MBC3536224.1 twin-arginine translocase subunit TatB [Megasphaera hominis]